VDEADNTHYVQFVMMRRHLIALFALISGLAAIQAPANAASLETMVQNAQGFARPNDTGIASVCVSVAKHEIRAIRRPQAPNLSVPVRTLGVIRPAIVFGSERALE